MKPAPLLGMLSLFALLCVGLIGGVTSLTNGDALTANTYYSGNSTTTDSTTPSLDGPRRNTDGGEKGDGPPQSSDDEEEVATTTIDLNNIQLPEWYVPVVITAPTTTPTNEGTQPSVQPNDSAPRVLITTPQPLPPPTTPPNTEERQEPQPPKEVEMSTSPVTASADGEESKERIRDIGSSLRQFQREVRRVENAIRERVTKEVENAFQQADRATVKEDSTKAFNPEERQRRIQELTSKLSRDVRTSIASGEVQPENPGDLQPVLKSSLEELRLLIKADTGVDVDLSPSARTVIDVVAENNPQVERAREDLLARDGLDLYGDSDRDGISNYDERHVYKTDPQNAFTSGSSLTDGERVLLGFDVLTKDTAQVPVESPKVAGAVVENVFEVHSINVALRPLEVTPGAQGESPVSDASALPTFTEEITFSGRALPNSFVTLYVFSTPVVVTVKADASGAWSYTLDTELEDGDHELYVATVDAGGRILAKSPAVPFVKRAEAAEFTPLLIPETPEVTPLSLLQSNLTLVGIVAFIVFALIALVILGVLRSGPKEPTVVA